MDTPNIAVHQ